MSRSSSPDGLSSSSESSASSYTSSRDRFALPPSEAARRLPLELLGMITTEAAKIMDDSPGGGWREAGLCLVSRSLLPFARAGLYHTICAYHCRDYDSEEVDATEAFDLNDPSAGFSDDSNVRRTLKENPSLGRLCRKLSVDVGYSDYQEDLEDHPVWTRVKELLYACPDVQSLSLSSDDSYAELVLDTIFAELAQQGWGSQLRSLTASFTGPGLLSFLSKLPHLQHLRLLQSDPGVDDSPPPAPLPSSLVSFDPSDGVPATIILNLVALSHTTLRTVKLTSSLLLAHPKLLPSLEVLEDLRVYLYDSDNLFTATPSDNQLRDLFALLGKCTTLQALAHNPSAESFGLRPPPLSILPPSLTSLDLAFLGITYSSISELLTSGSHPHLRKLTCDRQDWSAEDKS